MVTLKNNFGVEPDKDAGVMTVSEGSTNDAKASVAGHPKAILICQKNSHPFQARTLILNTPAKIGRSVARARPSNYNGIFDCKVLSRNHAIIWYEFETGKFMIQDTKSSNGTFVNNQRLSKGGEQSLPREFFSRDVVQFGVDVLENQRKGNEESENSDESNHIVTHGCIVATVRLFHPNGTESKSGQTYTAPNPMISITDEKICKLEIIIHEAQQREERLHDKLEELQLIIGKLEISGQEALTNRFEETRLLSKIENLEKQTKLMNKLMSGGSGKGSEKGEAEVQQLLVDIEKVQSVAREIQERQHRKLLESEQKLVEAQRVASNLELEVIALREQATLSESHLQEMGAKCAAYCQSIETLKSNFAAQIELTQKLEARVANFEKRDVERDLKMNFTELNIMDKYKFMSDESEDDMIKKDKENQEVILEWCKSYEESDKMEEKDFISEEDKKEWLTKKLDNLTDAMFNGLEYISNCIGQLENSLIDVERYKKSVEKLCLRKHELALQLESAKLPVGGNEKTENDMDGEKRELVKPVILSLLSNEKITEIENELKEKEDLLSQARVKQKESEGNCTKLRCELDATIKRCEKLNLESCNLKTLLKNQMKSIEESSNSYRQKIVKLESEVEELENGQQQKLLEILGNKCKNMEVKETQTSPAILISSSTNTDLEEKPNSTQEPTSVAVKVSQTEKVESSESQKAPSPSQDSIDHAKGESPQSDSPAEPLEELKLLKKLEGEMKSQDPETFGTGSDWSSNNSGVWEKIQKVQNLLSNQLSSSDSSLSNVQIVEMKNLMNLVAEDLVYLLLREQQISKDKQCLQDKLHKSLSKNDISSLGLAMQLRTVVLFSVTAIVAYFIYFTFA